MAVEISSAVNVVEYLRDYCDNKTLSFENVTNNDISSERFVLSLIDNLNNGATTYKDAGGDKTIASANYIAANVSKITPGARCCPVSWDDNTLDMVSYFNKDYSWAQKTLPASVNWSSVAFDGTKFVAVAGGSATGAYSTDGKTWKSVSMPSAGNWTSIAYGNGVFVAVAWEGSTSKVVAYSTNGTSWTTYTLPVWGYYQSVAYGLGKFVAISYTGTMPVYSSDGKTWSQSSITQDAWYAMAFGNNRFVAVAASSANVAVSTNGTSWTVSPSMKAARDWRRIAFGNGVFVALAWETNIAAWSTDGVTWTEVTLPATGNWYALTYGGDRFIATTYGGTAAAYSFNGKTWTSFSMPSAQNWTALTYGLNGYAAVAGDPSNVAAWGEMTISGNIHRWAIGNNCALNGTDITQMCTIVNVAGTGTCSGTTCSCQRTHKNGVASTNTAVSLNISFASTAACNQGCAPACADNAANNTNGGRGAIICGN